MRITIVIGPYFPVPPVSASGVEKMWYGLARSFAAKNHKVVIVSRRYGSLPRVQVESGIKHIRIPSIDAPRSKLAYRAYDAIYSLRAKSVLPTDADILVSNCMWLPIFVRGDRYGSLYVHVARRPKGQMRYYRHAPRIQTVSEAMLAAILAESEVRSERVRVIPPFVNSRILTDDTKDLIVKREKYIIYVGRLHPEKGVDILVRAFVKLARGDWKLLVVGPHELHRGGGGDSYLSSLKQIASTYAGQIMFEGSLTEPELIQKYRISSLLVYPSVAETGESFGVVPLEAMACGCPVVVSNLDCFRDFVRAGINGCVFDHRAHDPVGGLALEMERLMSDETLRSAIAEQGLKTAKRYDLEIIADRFIRDFEVISRMRK